MTSFSPDYRLASVSWAFFTRRRERCRPALHRHTPSSPLHHLASSLSSWTASLHPSPLSHPSVRSYAFHRVVVGLLWLPSRSFHQAPTNIPTQFMTPDTTKDRHASAADHSHLVRPSDSSTDSTGDRTKQLTDFRAAPDLQLQHHHHAPPIVDLLSISLS